MSSPDSWIRDHPALEPIRTEVFGWAPESHIMQLVHRELSRLRMSAVASDEIAAVIAFARQPFWLTIAADTIRAMRA